MKELIGILGIVVGLFVIGSAIAETGRLNISGDATKCFAVQNNQIMNVCGDTSISVSWCSDDNQGNSCAHGMNSVVTLNPPPSPPNPPPNKWPLHPLGDPGLVTTNVTAVVCAGANAVWPDAKNKMKAKCGRTPDSGTLYMPGAILPPVVKFKNP